MKGLVLESAGPGDLDALLEIERTSYSHPWTRRNFEGELAVEQGTFLVLREAANRESTDGGLRGYCAFRVVAGEMHLMNLTVAPGGRRQGLGRLLLRLVLDLGARREARACHLEVREGNTAALGLYRTSGFVEAGRRKGYYNQPREDALMLQRDLLPGGRKEP
ncbi:MAG TPA: ribosomal protein S18-alanine N-acetyltransferase [Vicinamibacteria bacterium]